MSQPPAIDGLFETHLTVADIDRSVAFYRDVIGLELALHLPERGAAFLWVGGSGTAMLGLWSLGSAPVGMSLHLAFRTPLADVLAACRGLRAAGCAPLSFFGIPTDEPSVIGWMPAAAVYVRDPDGHLVELLAMLDEPPEPDAGIVPWSRWRAGAAEQPPLIELHAGRRDELRELFEEAESSTDQLDRYLDAGEVLVARSGGRVVGHAQLLAHDDRLEIKNMAVAVAWRGRGVGRRLVDAATEHARRRGHRRLVVGTAAAGIGNLRFYQRVGFRLDAIERDVFTAASGYGVDERIDGVPLRDRVWLDLLVDQPLR